MAVWDDKNLGADVLPEAAPEDGVMPRDLTGGVGDATEFSDAAFAPPKRSAAGGMLLVAAVLAIAAATLYAMRVSGHVEATDASLAGVEKKIDQALQRLKGESRPDPTLSPDALTAMFKDTDEVVAAFASDPTKKQVTLDHLQKNPFELFVSDSGKPAASKSADDLAAERVKAERQKVLRREFEGLKLQSLLSGNGGAGLAVVSGKVVREGDAVGSFTVAGISPSGVLMTADGNSWALSMEKPGEKPAK